MGGYLAKSANMMRQEANKPVSPAPGIFSPLRYAVFRRIWTASLLSNLGLLVLGVGAAWSMTKISSSTSMVALVQTSSRSRSPASSALARARCEAVVIANAAAH